MLRESTSKEKVSHPNPDAPGARVVLKLFKKSAPAFLPTAARQQDECGDSEEEGGGWFRHDAAIQHHIVDGDDADGAAIAVIQINPESDRIG